MHKPRFGGVFCWFIPRKFMACIVVLGLLETFVAQLKNRSLHCPKP